jgi:hypothetical protein
MSWMASGQEFTSPSGDRLLVRHTGLLVRHTGLLVRHTGKRLFQVQELHRSLNEMSERTHKDQEPEQIDEARRRLGKFAAYTAPAMVTLLISEKAVANSGGGGGWGKAPQRPGDAGHLGGVQKLVKLARSLAK